MRNNDEFVKRLILQNATFLTLKEKSLLFRNIDNSSDIAVLSKDDLSSIIKRDVRRTFWDGKNALRVSETALRIIEAFNIQYTCFDFDDYPPMLRAMADSPYMIFYRGNLSVLNKQCVSVVGTRRATAGARRAAGAFSRDAAADDWTVVSGLAYGIDIESHKGALSASAGGTVAVLPCGIDTIVPSAHTKIAAKIVETGGLLMSEYVPGTPAVAFRFVQRNRIIAALSSITVVIQAPVGSGAMITAALALDYNRNVMFHKEAFSADAQKLNRLEIDRLRSEISAGKKIGAKLENSPDAFVRDGAFVIESFAQFKEFR